MKIKDIKLKKYEIANIESAQFRSVCADWKHFIKDPTQPRPDIGYENNLAEHLFNNICNTRRTGRSPQVLGGHVAKQITNIRTKQRKDKY